MSELTLEGYTSRESLYQNKPETEGEKNNTIAREIGRVTLFEELAIEMPKTETTTPRAVTRYATAKPGGTVPDTDA